MSHTDRNEMKNHHTQQGVCLRSLEVECPSSLTNARRRDSENNEGELKVFQSPLATEGCVKQKRHKQKSNFYFRFTPLEDFMKI